MTQRPSNDVVLLFAGLGMILILYQVLWHFLVTQ